MFLKKIVTLMFIALFAIFCLSACGNEDQEKSGSGETAATQTIDVKGPNSETPAVQTTNAEDPNNAVNFENIDSNKKIENKEKIVTKASNVKCSHNYYKENITKATCTSGGYTTYKCKKCGEKKIGQKTAALNHNYDGGSITKPASCTENGIKTFTCVNCHQTYLESIGALGHNFSGWEASGKVHKHTCSKCGSAETSSHIWDSDGDECVDCGIINFD